MSEFNGERYVVTSAASGIGNAVAEQLLAAGADVICLDHDTPTAKVTHHIEVELADPQSIDAAMEQLDRQLDGLLNVAGIPGTAPAERIFAVNTLAIPRHLTESSSTSWFPAGQRHRLLYRGFGGTCARRHP